MRGARGGATLVQGQHLLDQGDPARVARHIGGVGEVGGADGHSEEGIQNDEPLIDDQLIDELIKLGRIDTYDKKTAPTH